ncbi:hypothetical protein FHR90_003341 [Endobacter medicaginis]|uniref:Uncharacterized protein n=1 Tax=Endobacter medicaginis TaxID=1181271 RepID=A0A839V3R1_9PROT|nr:hypothetical protein [Endobacter medicaginis]MBB3175485.1 hypothetical protein [Endobacter medicaginis]MCX5476724.1 hypothetical protein [Endobacter medicaginis]NVN30033.1 hypothetical protein [Endobacter medicaginis]
MLKNFAQVIRSAVAAAVRSLRTVFRLAFIGGRYVLQQSVEVVEQVARVPLSVAGIGADFVGQLGARFRLAMGGAQHEQQNEASARQRGVAQQNRQERSTDASAAERAHLRRQATAMRRYAADRLAGRDSDERVVQLLPAPVRSYLDALDRDELELVMSAPGTALITAISSQGGYTVRGVRPMGDVVQAPERASDASATADQARKMAAELNCSAQLAPSR